MSSSYKTPRISFIFGLYISHARTIRFAEYFNVLYIRRYNAMQIHELNTIVTVNIWLPVDSTPFLALKSFKGHSK